MCSVPPSTRRTSLEMSRRQPVLSSSVEKLFMMTKKKDVGPCSQSTDRKVSKIILHTEPMVQEEQYNCTSSGALNTVALQQRKDKVPRPIPVAAKENLFQKTRSSVFKERGAQGRWRSNPTKPAYYCTHLYIYSFGCLFVFLHVLTLYRYFYTKYSSV